MLRKVSAKDILAERRFTCAVCGQEAGLIRVFGPVGNPTFVRDCFTSRIEGPLRIGISVEFRRAVAEGDCRALRAIDSEIPSFYCPECDACYCTKHWDHHLVFDADMYPDYIQGTCPKGHRHILED